MIPFDLTVCIPTFNGSDTIQKAINSLLIQGLNLRILIADNGSTDGTLEMLTKAISNGWYGNQTVELYDAKRVKGARRENIAHVRKFLVEKVKTKYMFWLDDDIKIPSFALKFMMELADANNKLGLVGLQYQSFNHHMAVGATLVLSGVAKKLTWQYLPGQPCECQGAIEEIKKMGYETMFMRRITALDLNYL